MSITPLNLKPSKQTKTTPTKSKLRDWRILVVDDEEEVHIVSRLILGKICYKGRGIEILSAYSAAEARRIIERENDIAVILLDVVMETDDAGLILVKVIREELGNDAVRIILRTGQPGQAPGEQIITNFDINDYKAKSELTAQKLFTTVVASMRSFETIVALEKNRMGLEKILDSTGELFKVDSLQSFASGVLMQLSSFLECQPNGIICVQADSSGLLDEGNCCDHLRILASSGEYASCIGYLKGENCSQEEMLKVMAQALRQEEMLKVMAQALRQEENKYSDKYTVLYLNTGGPQGTVALLHGGLGAADQADLKLLELFTSKIAIAMANALNYQKLVRAEEAATTDFLTGLDNRRQLLRIGTPLVAAAARANTPLAVAMLDIDHFKSVNDRWGHDAGDEVLKRVGELIKERFRTSDVSARFGGEEFCVVATGLSPEVAFDLFDGFRQQFEVEKFEFGGKKMSFTISIGVTLKVNNCLDSMISDADSLLYSAKDSGRNRVCVAE